MNYQEIIEKLKHSDVSVEAFAYEDFEEEVAGPYTIVSEKGGEDKGSEWHKVFHFKDHDVYIMVEGWYSSYHGTDFEGWDDAVSEVRPQEKVITVYE